MEKELAAYARHMFIRLMYPEVVIISSKRLNPSTSSCYTYGRFITDPTFGPNPLRVWPHLIDVLWSLY